MATMPSPGSANRTSPRRRLKGRFRDQGKRAAARDLLAPVYGWFTEGLGTPVLQEAKALSDELSADPSAGMGDGVAPAPTSSRNVMYDST